MDSSEVRLSIPAGMDYALLCGTNDCILRKIEELIEEDSPVVQLKPGELIVRLSYIQRNVSEPLISTVSRKFDITLNIIFSDIAIVQNAPIGGTVAIISGERAQITQAMQYLSEKNVGVEVIRDARISE